MKGWMKALGALAVVVSVAPDLDLRFGSGGREAGQARGVVSAQTPPALFSDGPTTSLLFPAGAQVRRRTALVDLDQLSGITGPGAAAPALTLNLFPNVVLTTTFERLENTGPGRAWIGRLERDALGVVVLASVDGALAGTVRSRDGLYRVRADTGGFAVISEIDPTLLPRREPALPRPPGTLRLSEPAAGAATRAVVDVAFYFTNTARDRIGSTPLMKSAIAADVAETNQVLINSRIPHRIRSVGMTGIRYRENPDRDLDRLQHPRDGHLDSLPRRRDRDRADLVHLITRDNSDYCGIAYAGVDQAYGYGITTWDCLGNLTMAHELGHNFGAFHDWYVEGPCPDCPAMSQMAYGHISRQGRFRTVMSYDDACADAVVSCPAVPFFSTPRLRTGAGFPMGIASGTRRSCQAGVYTTRHCDADNGRVFHTTMKQVASYR